MIKNSTSISVLMLNYVTEHGSSVTINSIRLMVSHNGEQGIWIEDFLLHLKQHPTRASRQSG